MQAMRPSAHKLCSNATPLERAEPLGYIVYECDLQKVASRLQHHGYRGAICGPDGCGKTTMLQALGDELMEHGLSPLPLHLAPDRSQALPMTWRRTIRKARHTDALLLDDYDLLPFWARAWVWAASTRAGAVVVASQREVRFKTLARPKPTAALLQKLVEQTRPAAASPIEYDAILAQCEGNLHEALGIARLHGVASDLSIKPSKKQAS